jgi:CDP-paratose 2-epimerase
MGGGPSQTISLVELMDLIAELAGDRPPFTVEPWRPADQRYYVSNTARFERLTGWSARVGVREGVERLLAWLIDASVAEPRAAAGKVAS